LEGQSAGLRVSALHHFVLTYARKFMLLIFFVFIVVFCTSRLHVGCRYFTRNILCTCNRYLQA
jgi:hypothetical protein